MAQFGLRVRRASLQDRPMLRLSLAVLGVTDMRRAVGFWSKVLRYQVAEGGPDSDWTVLSPAGGTEPGTELALQLSTTPPQDHPRIHLDLSVDSADEQAAEIRRLVGLGAERVDCDLYPQDPDLVVLADTEGNRFCVTDASPR
jgi:predicted enzyme related to lactoylglutathione lyase